jgi:hypothetical protein
MNLLGRNVSRRLGTPAKAAALLAAVLLAAMIAAPAQAAKPVSSLDIVPANAAFYSAMLRNREQYDAIVNSKALKKLKELQYVQMGLAILQIQTADPNSPAGQFQAALNDPEMKQSLAFAADLLSDEVFIYGGPSFYKTVQLVQNVYGAVQYEGYMEGVRSALEAPRTGKPPAAKPANEQIEMQGRAFVRALISQIDLVKVPEMVMGFKVKDQAVAKQQLDKLAANLEKLLDQQPPLKKRLQKKTIGGYSYLTLTLDGGMVPWDKEAVEKIHGWAETPAAGDKLIARLKKTTLVVSLGLRDDYLVLAIGPTADGLAQLGTGTPLRAAPELAAVAKFAEKRICSVNYASKAWNALFGPNQAGIDNLLQMGKKALPSLPVESKLREDIAKDAADLAEDVKKLIIPPGAASSISFLTESGVESYDYDWSPHPELDSSQPLTLLKHIGGSPIAFLVGRSKVSMDGYDFLVKWIGVGQRYLEEYGVPKMEKKDRDQFEKIYAGVKPLLGRIDKTTRNLLIPALSDGQTGLVIDAKFTSRQFIKSIPQTEKALTMLEPAIIVGVSDAPKLRKAFSEYYAVADDFVEFLKGIEKSEVPADFKLPRPKVYNLRSGKAYGYPMPPELGVDSHFMPNAGLSEKVGVLSLSGKHTIRLLEESEPTVVGIKLSTDRPLAMVGGLDFAAFIDALTPWIEVGLDSAAPQMPPDAVEQVREHVKVALAVLKVFRGSVSETYVEDNVTVTHSRTEIHDIAE